LLEPTWTGVLIVWLLLLWALPDPRPLAAPEWAVQQAQAWLSIAEPTARALVTLLFRVAGIAALGILASLALVRLPTGQAALFTLIGVPLAAVFAKWMNFGYFPTTAQLALIVAAAVGGALAGLALRRSRAALMALGLFVAALFTWGTPTRLSDDLFEAARITGQHVSAQFSELPDDADRFARLTELAFAYAEDNSHGTDPVFPNEAAILALGVILGDDRIAAVGRRELYAGSAGERETLRQQVRVHGRSDLSQHFWVSAALTVLSDPGRAMTVGITKEMQDATPGGSGFSFVDMAANLAGIRFAVVATHNTQAARDLQLRIAKGFATADFFPAIDGLPEGLSQDRFHAEFGGLGGAPARRLFADIDQRIAALPGLQRLR
jgi:hypothetical protein